MTVESRAEWRRWLERHHTQRESIWLVTYKKGSGNPHLSYDDIVCEALCFGWIDSLPRKLDEQRTMLRLSPRKATSAWSALNKTRVARLIEEGRMTPTGLAMIALAKSNGLWTKLDGVERLTAPDDLAAALKRNSKAGKFFAAFPPSSRRAILEWITNAKAPETRARRIAETVRLAAQNLKANHPAGRNAGPKTKSG